MFRINGVTVHEPAKEGVAITDEPIWASNTGRAASGLMTGDFIGWKTTVEVTWPPLKYADALLIRDTIKNAGPFFTVEYNDGSSSTSVSKTVYASNVPRSLYSLVPGHQWYSGVTVTFIEQ